MRKNYLFVLLAIIFTMNVMAQNIPSYVPKDGLVGFWPFNGNANDESGKGNHGTVNGATLSSDRNGVANSAYDFDGIDDYINIPNNSSLQIVNEITLSAWVRPDTIFSVPKSFGGRIIDKCTVGSTDGYLLDLGANVNGIQGGLEKRGRFIGVKTNLSRPNFIL